MWTWLTPRNHLFVILATVIGITSLAALLWITPPESTIQNLNVAFVGNSMMFVNDIPRFMEALSGYHLVQNSCLHGSLNLGSLLKRGNGMYEKFMHSHSMSNGFYDYGACTVPQLLLGYDENLQPGNANDYYINDGTNPCLLANESYYEHVQNTLEAQGPPTWDFVIMNDQTMYPGIPEKRSRTVQVLQGTYSNYFLLQEQVNNNATTSARPVFFMTYAYRYNDGRYSLGDIPQFTSHVYYGYQQYVSALASILPASQQPLLAPVGIAFLVLWEENYGLWERLFYTDNIHPSPHGSYLIGCVLYATLYGQMPLASVAVPSNVASLWDRARRMQVDRHGDDMPIPTRAEAYFLYQVAERVVMQGYRPKSLLSEQQVMQLEEAQDNDKENIRL